MAVVFLKLGGYDGRAHATTDRIAVVALKIAGRTAACRYCRSRPGWAPPHSQFAFVRRTEIRFFGGDIWEKTPGCEITRLRVEPRLKIRHPAILVERIGHRRHGQLTQVVYTTNAS